MSFLTRRRSSAFLLIPLLSFLICTFGFEEEVPDNIQVIQSFTSSPKAQVLDSIQFVSSWTPTYCRNRNCITPLDAKFVLHGLWPADPTGANIIDCATTETSKTLLNVYTRIGKELPEQWYTLIKGQTNAQFWDNQWFKHGSCSKLTAASYFRAGIEQQKKINLTQVFIDGGVKPSATNTYTKSRIISAIQKKIGNNNHIYMSCQSPGQNIFHVSEIVICLDTQAQNYKSCPQDGLARGCGRPNDNVMFVPT